MGRKVLIKTVVLMGGYATRLRPLSITRPKPLFPILDKPILDWIVEGLKNTGIKNFIFSTKYMAHAIRKKYGDGSSLGVNIRYAHEKTPLGDAGPLRFIHKLYGLDETFMVVNGDIFGNINYEETLKFHREKGGIATMVLAKVKDPSRFGVVVLDDDRKITDFIEKPEAGKAPSKIVNAGVYVFEKEVIDMIPEGKRTKLARDLIPKLLQKADVYGYIHEGYWADIGSLPDFLQTSFDAIDYYYPEGYVSSDANISPKAEIIQPVYISGNVEVKEGASIGPYTILGEETIVEKSARVSRSVIFPSCIIDYAAKVKNTILGQDSIIGRWVTLEENVVVGDGVTIFDEVTVAPEVIIFPFKEIESNVSEVGKIII